MNDYRNSTYPCVVEKRCPKCKGMHYVVLYSVKEKYNKPPCANCRVHGKGRKPYVVMSKRPNCEQSVDNEIRERERRRIAMFERHDERCAEYRRLLSKTIKPYRREDNE